MQQKSSKYVPLFGAFGGGLIFKSVLTVLNAFSIAQVIIIIKNLSLDSFYWLCSLSNHPTCIVFKLVLSIITFISPSSFKYLLYPRLFMPNLVNFPVLICFQAFESLSRFCLSFFALLSE